MSIANVRANSEYQEAVRTTEEFDSPAVGFAKPSDYKTGVLAQTTAIIKQNNTLLYLITKQGQRILDIEEQLDQLKRRLEAGKEIQPIDLEESISSLTKRLDQFTITGKSAPNPKKQGPIYFYQDPKKIFQEEYSKATKQ